ncbi:hypothetical protein E1B28_001526 [Marasmius oreades]|uniref:Glycosyltransferase n=1 Tax=Marasmius oreades TaxID=181124 RepID=A0A9P7V3R8_9AGAR|nr:uncharacterized protein E1B28_001526 [Marasmius oreades]KAG7099707.1 hypothetical protein E1B28_001526 [Marasmius oreades]
MSTPNLFFAVVVALSALLSIKYCRFGPKDTFLKLQQQSHFPASFRADEAESSLERLSLQHLTKLNATAADITAVILNWTRLSNVVRIVSLLCDPMLDGILATIFIWNNNPATVLTQEQLGCQHKLRLFNSPTNAYFGARFEACVAASTPFCFIQDDDYLVLPEILYTLRSRISELSVSGIFLQPPNEMLSSTLSRITLNSKIHTSFSWLGYGSMIRRSEAKDFLSLMRLLNVTDDEFKMADNYFSILRNVFTENWFDQNIPLGGGLPFTVGQEGLERNNRHILRAADLLESVLLCEHPPCISLPAQIQDIPYVQSRPTSPSSSSMAPCVGAVCLLETSISMLPNEPKTEVQSTRNILEIQEKNIQSINGKELDLYLNHPPSYAVDGNPETGFCRGSAKFVLRVTSFRGLRIC